MTKRRPLSFIAWSSITGRASEIASELDGESRCFFDLGIRRRSLLPVRYALSAVRTVGYLVLRRPGAVIVTNPPVFAALAAYPYCRLTGAPLLLDSHPDAFRTDGNHTRFLPIHRWLARRARASLVTTDDLVRQVESWGGRAIVVHEPPPAWAIDTPAPLPERPRVLVLGTLSPDEPVEEVIRAARALPDVDLELTGDAGNLGALVDEAPENVRFLGFLREREYVAALERASVAVVLTTWLRWAVPRSAYDAVYARRPLVLTATPVLADLFPFAILVDNDGDAITTGIRRAIGEHAALVQAAPQAFDVQAGRWARQLEQLRELTRPGPQP